MMGKEFRSTKKADWVISGVPMAFFNAVVRTDFPRDASRDIERLVAKFEASGVPMGWDVGPFDSPPDLADQLVAHGFKREDSVPAMVMELRDLRSPEGPEGLTIRRVDGKRELREWSSLWSEQFEIPLEAREPLARFFRRKEASGDDDVISYSGFLGNRLVGISTLFLGSKAVGLYNVATAPDARGRGVGTAMTCVALEEGRKRGYKLATLQSSKLGYGIYRKLGFEQCFEFHGYERQLKAVGQPNKC